ncbi:MAG: hypothetical protein FJZ01_20025 [Candidatus Sericytochromatia bacterium]|nr:hypothetical protein [Candidatus Tanganyikabacteria bacterium]
MGGHTFLRRSLRRAAGLVTAATLLGCAPRLFFPTAKTTAKSAIPTIEVKGSTLEAQTLALSDDSVVFAGETLMGANTRLSQFVTPVQNQEPLRNAPLIGNAGAGLIGNAGAGLIGNAGAGLIGNAGAGLIGNAGAGLIGNAGAGLIGNAGAGLIGNAGAGYRTQVHGGPQPATVLIEVVDPSTGVAVATVIQGKDGKYAAKIPKTASQRGLMIQATAIVGREVSGFLSSPVSVAPNATGGVPVDLTAGTTTVSMTNILLLNGGKHFHLQKGFRGLKSTELVAMVAYQKQETIEAAARTIDRSVAKAVDKGAATPAQGSGAPVAVTALSFDTLITKTQTVAQTIAKKSAEKSQEAGNSLAALTATTGQILDTLAKQAPAPVPTPRPTPKPTPTPDPAATPAPTPAPGATPAPTPEPEPEVEAEEDLLLVELDTAITALLAEVKEAASKVDVEAIKKEATEIVKTAAERPVEIVAEAPPPAVVAATIPPPPPLIIRSITLAPATSIINAPPATGKADKRYRTSIKLTGFLDASDGFPHEVTWKLTGPDLVTIATDSFNPEATIVARPYTARGSVLVTCTSIDDPRVSATASVFVDGVGGVAAELR